MGKPRKLLEILLDLEVIIDEMADDHEMEWGDIRALVMNHLKVHHPGSREHYVDGGYPVDFYGPEEELVEILRRDHVVYRKNRRTDGKRKKRKAR